MATLNACASSARRSISRMRRFPFAFRRPTSASTPPRCLPRSKARASGRRDRPLMPIRFAVGGHIARVTIDRPEELNAIDMASERELQRIWAAIEADREVRVVVLTGAGERAFSAGADMKGGSGGSGLDYWANEREGGFG